MLLVRDDCHAGACKICAAAHIESTSIDNVDAGRHRDGGAVVERNTVAIHARRQCPRPPSIALGIAVAAAGIRGHCNAGVRIGYVRLCGLERAGRIDRSAVIDGGAAADRHGLGVQLRTARQRKSGLIRRVHCETALHEIGHGAIAHGKAAGAADVELQ